MNRTFRMTTSRILGSLAFGATLLTAAAAHAAPAMVPPTAPPAAPPTGSDSEAATLQSKLASVLGRPGGLTSAVVATRAEATSFDVQSKREDLDAAAALVDQALVAYFPRLSVTGRYTRLSPIDPPSLGNSVVTPRDVGPGPIPPGTPLVNVPFVFPVLLNQTLLQATLNVPLSDYLLRIPQAYAAATQNEKVAALSENATRLKVATDGKVVYYTWVRAKLQEVVADQALLQARAHLVDAQHAFDAGTISKADVLRIESQVAASRLLVERAKSMAEITETQIRVAMHDTAPLSYEVGEAIDGEAPRVPGADNLAALWTEAGATRLEIKTLEQTSNALREQAKVARAGNLPRIDAFGDIIYANPNQRIFPLQDAFKATWDVGVQLTYSPNDIALAGASSRNLNARAASFAAQKQALEDGIRVEVTQTRNALREALAAVESTTQGLVAAEESYRVRRSLFRNGRATGVELTDAETELTRSRLESINARVDVRVAQVRLEHALGRDVARGNR
ncbi:MAG TPA: TolC family protein [Polyangiaceae bacterium]|nr:TolC family protein [Polyangiaceae bacterium]